jgi:hypothetical protein
MTFVVGNGIDQMSCPTSDAILLDVEYYRKRINHFLLLKKEHGLSDENAKRSAKHAASALAKARNQFHWHQNHCDICGKTTAGNNKPTGGD